MPRTGRPTIFRKNVDGVAVRGIISKIGAAELERQRAALKTLYKSVMGFPWTGTVSDADVIEALARGEEATRAYLRQVKRETEQAAK